MVAHILTCAWNLLQHRGGLSNQLYRCVNRNRVGVPATASASDDQEVPSCVLLRLYGGDSAFVSREHDNIIFAILAERRVGPELHGIFTEGRIEEFIESRTLQRKDLAIADLSRNIARRLAAFHSFPLPLSKQPCLFVYIERWQAMAAEVLRVSMAEAQPALASSQLAVPPAQPSRSRSNSDLNDGLARIRSTHSGTNIPDRVGRTATRESPINVTRPLSANDLKLLLDLTTTDFGTAEAQWLKAFLLRVPSPVVFCHNDLQEGNILEPSSARDTSFRRRPLRFIDYEYGAYNYRAFDIANHFCEWSIDYNVDAAPYFSITGKDFPTRAQQEIFIQSYLSAWECVDDRVAASLFEGDDDDSDRPTATATTTTAAASAAPQVRRAASIRTSPITPDEVARVVREVNAYVLASHFMWSVWSIVQAATSDIAFGYVEYAVQRLEVYFALKAQLLASGEYSDDQSH
ncbi:choline kinase, variant [Capsaspora owczarzaki ATCC 30864]|uniref:Choline kinase, variant n=1 Tax=Capsaspora owczarzaki (strain ATCC 30864) TaxID=595528 RepID=A0A0D2X1H4_CAPO3|nr:choline kinase, variant [Capsaspora owczarzaki ATCC 30864]